jgi:glycosyltransferase 2 family protein
MRNPVIKRLIWILVFAVLLYTAFIVWSDSRKNLETLRAFPWRTLPLILGAVLVNFLLRWVKWEYYRRAAGIRVPLAGSFLVFFSGFSMAISPGRIGELIKPFMYKEYFDQKMRRTIPLVFCERVSDLLGMIVLGALTIVPFMSGLAVASVQGSVSRGLVYGFLALSVVTMAVMIWLIRQKRIIYGMLLAAGRHRRLQAPLSKARRLYRSTYPLLTARNLLITTAMAMFSWFFECVAVLVVLHGVGADAVTLRDATFVFCMATIFGGFLFFLPGGLGGFEASMIALLALMGIAVGQAVPATFIIRVCTLFFSVALGFSFILITSATYHKRLEWEEFEHADEVEPAEE